MNSLVTLVVKYLIAEVIDLSADYLNEKITKRKVEKRKSERKQKHLRNLAEEVNKRVDEQLSNGEEVVTVTVDGVTTRTSVTTQSKYIEKE
jgi:hypothetical protein